MPVDHDDPDPKRFGLEIGVVVDREDPKGIGRVRVRIPGLIDERSAWAFPLGAPGGGSKNRGLWWIPEVGAEVAILFKNGDIDHPYYMVANWGAPGGTAESPDASDGGDPDVRAFGFGPYDLVIDTRDGRKKFRIVDSDASDNVIEFDGVTRTLQLSSTVGIQIKSTGTIDIQGLVVTINGIPAGSGRL